MMRRNAALLCALWAAGCGAEADLDDGSRLERDTRSVMVGAGGLSDPIAFVVPVDAVSLHFSVRAPSGTTPGKLGLDLVQDGALRVSFMTPATADDALLSLHDEIAWGTPASTVALARTPAGGWRARVFHDQGALAAPVELTATWRRGSVGAPRGRLPVALVLVGDVDGARARAALGDAADLLQVPIDIVAQVQVSAVDAAPFTSVDVSGGPDAAALRALFTLELALPERALPLYLVPRLVEMTPTGGLDVFGSSGGVPIPLAAGGAHGGVAVSASALEADQRTGAITMAHEIGHALGLLHTSEPNGRSHDRLTSTPECGVARDRNASGTLLPDECGGAGADNLMFWALGSTRPRLTEEQRAVIGRSPFLAPAPMP